MVHCLVNAVRADGIRMQMRLKLIKNIRGSVELNK